jgi:hypothetical protein
MRGRRRKEEDRGGVLREYDASDDGTKCAYEMQYYYWLWRTTTRIRLKKKTRSSHHGVRAEYVIMIRTTTKKREREYAALHYGIVKRGGEWGRSDVRSLLDKVEMAVKNSRTTTDATTVRGNQP